MRITFREFCEAKSDNLAINPGYTYEKKRNVQPEIYSKIANNRRKYEPDETEIQKIIELGQKGYTPYGIALSIADDSGNLIPINSIRRILKNNKINYNVGKDELKSRFRQLDDEMKMTSRSMWDKPYLQDDENTEKAINKFAIDTFKNEIREKYKQGLFKFGSELTGDRTTEIEPEHLEKALDYLVVKDFEKYKDSPLQKVLGFARKISKNLGDWKDAVRIGWRKLLDDTPTRQEIIRKLLDLSMPDEHEKLSHSIKMTSPIVNPYIKTGLSTSEKLKNAGIKFSDLAKRGLKTTWDKTAGQFLPQPPRKPSIDYKPMYTKPPKPKNITPIEMS